MVRPLCPAPWCLKTLARKDCHSRRYGHISPQVKVAIVFPIESCQRNRRVGQPVERDVVEHVVARKSTSRMSVDRMPGHRRGYRRRWLTITVPMIEQPGCKARRGIRQAGQSLRAPRDLRIGTSLENDSSSCLKACSSSADRPAGGGSPHWSTFMISGGASAPSWPGRALANARPRGD
jgi:hypothetical protein